MKKRLLYSISALAMLPVYSLFKAHHDHIVYNIMRDSRLPVEINKLQLLFVADLHRRLLSKKTIATLRKNPFDFILIGGDLIENGVPLVKIKKNLERLQQLNAPIYFVWGNNDIVYGKEKICKCLLEYGVHILEDKNECIRIGNQEILLTGLGYYENYQPKLDALFTVSQDKYRIVLAHTPFIYDSLKEEQKEVTNVFLAGHTHGGQLRLGNYGIYPRGSYQQKDNTHILVTEGYGYRLIPFRLGTNAECHVITITKNN